MDIESSKLTTETSASPASHLVARENWRKFRTHIETGRAKSNITRYYPRRKWILFTLILNVFGLLMWLSRFSVRGKKNATDLTLNSFDIEIPGLPKEFDGFEIIHMTDLHLDRVVGLEFKILKLLEGTCPDAIVMTGDYKDNMKKAASWYESAFRLFGENLKSPCGLYATLGNHDTADLVPFMEKHGIKVLINESVEIVKGKSKITLTGVDDVHYYFSPAATKALDESPPNSCKILLVHSPEMVREAADRNYSLYLCGHTHAGQIATPKGKAIITHVNTGREFSVGRWMHQNLQGYTSSGAGVSGLTLRFFTKAEIARIRLKSYPA